MTGIMMSHAAIVAQAGASGGGGGPLTYYQAHYWITDGDYSEQGSNVRDSNVWTTMSYGWPNGTDFSTVVAFTSSGTPISMVFAGVSYSGTISGFVDSDPGFFGPGVLYQTTITWTEATPSGLTPSGIGMDSVTIGGVTYNWTTPTQISPAPSYRDGGVSAGDTTVQIQEQDYNLVSYWYTPSDYTLIKSYTTGKQISVVYHTVGYTGTLTSGWSQPDVENFPYLWEASVTWDDSAGLASGYTDGVESVTI
jgi:hypothetical protein